MRNLKALIAPMMLLALLAPAGMASRAVAAPESAGGFTSAAGTAKTAPAEPEKKDEPGLISFEANTAIWVLIIFIILLVILYRTAWKNVLTGLKTREERIRSDISSAEAARAKSEESLKDYSAQLATAEAKARDIINEAALQAQRIADQNRTRVTEEAEQIRERAMKDIEDARKQAVAQIYEEAATLATSVAEKILRRSLNADDQRDLVNRSLDQIGNAARN
jgi:F-type H+-transporting ATPase subunit b